MKRAHGFGLLEVVVAVAIFALAMALAYGGLQGVIRARDQLDREAAQLAALQQTVLLLERDLRALVDRPVRDEGGREQPALLLDGSRFALTRGGHAQGLAQARAELLRVEWRLDGKRLRRHAFAVLDRAGSAPDAELATQDMLDGLDRVVVEALDADGRWNARWPLPAAAATPPRAVRIRLEAPAFGSIERVFELPEPPP